VVFAAASLTDSLREAGKVYEAKSKDKILFNFAASSILARQLEEGAAADIFFSADEDKMNALDKKGLIKTRKSRLSNTLVIIVAAERGAAVNQPQDLAGSQVKRLALAETRTVPAGIYAKKYLQSQTLWGLVESKVVPTENVRGALSAVESGDADAAIVYKTDAAISKKVKVAYEIPATEAPDISYPAGILKGSKQPEAAEGFYRFLDSKEAGGIFKRYGFGLRD